MWRLPLLSQCKHSRCLWGKWETHQHHSTGRSRAVNSPAASHDGVMWESSTASHDAINTTRSSGGAKRPQHRRSFADLLKGTGTPIPKSFLFRQAGEPLPRLRRHLLGLCSTRSALHVDRKGLPNGQSLLRHGSSVAPGWLRLPSAISLSRGGTSSAMEKSSIPPATSTRSSSLLLPPWKLPCRKPVGFMARGHHTCKGKRGSFLLRQPCLDPPSLAPPPRSGS